MTRALTKEFKLVCACCRWPRDQHAENAIRGAAEGGIDWPRVWAIAERHRVQALVATGLRAANLSLPEPVASTAAIGLKRLARRSLAQMGAMQTLQARFAEKGIAMRSVKGLVVAMQAYGTASIKSSKDVDILVAPADIARAAALLKACGYRRFSPGPDLDDSRLEAWHQFNKESKWLGANDVLIELHSRLTDDPSMSKAIDIQSNGEPVSLQPGLEFETMPVADLYVYLAIHGASHGWRRLKWLADFAALTARYPGRIEALHQAAAECGAGRHSAQGLLLAAEWVGLPVPPGLLAKLRRNPANRLLLWVAGRAAAGNYEVNEHVHRTMEYPLVLLSLFVLRRGPVAKLSQLRWLTINPQDRARQALPPRLGFLYPFLGLHRMTLRALGLYRKPAA